MIELTRLNGHSILVNCDHIRFVEASPDTVITLAHGEKLLVTETPATIAQIAAAWRAGVLRAAWPAADSVFIPTA